MDYLMIAAKKIRKRLRDDGDAFIVIDGPERAGKSSFMLRFAKMIDSKFTLDQIVYRKGKLINCIYFYPKYSVVVHDELGLDAYKRRGMSRGNVELKQASMVWGDQNKAVLACIPNFWDLDGSLQQRTYLWIHIDLKERDDGSLSRGRAEFHYAKKSKWYSDPNWDEVCSQKFDAVPSPIYKEYKERKHKAVKEALKEDEKDNDPREKSIELVRRMKDLGYTQKESAEVLGCSQQNISAMLSAD
jgi:hypothetical protein